MSYLNSGDVTVFPSTRRTSAYAQRSRLISEMSLTGLINQLTDKKSFVISQTADESTIKFNINGYYFEVNTAHTKELLVDASSSLYAHVTFDTTTDGYTELSGQDETESEVSVYKGLVLDNSSAGTEANTLKILASDAQNVMYIPSESLLQFNQNRVEIEEIDGGEI